MSFKPSLSDEETILRYVELTEGLLVHIDTSRFHVWDRMESLRRMGTRMREIAQRMRNETDDMR